MKSLLSAFHLKVSEVHDGVEPLVQLQSIVAIRLEVLVQHFNVRFVVLLAVRVVFEVASGALLILLITVSQACRYR